LPKPIPTGPEDQPNPA